MHVLEIFIENVREKANQTVLNCVIGQIHSFTMSLLSCNVITKQNDAL